MNNDSHGLTFWEKMTAIPFAVYPVSVLVMAVGQFTGDYVGLYAQTELGHILSTAFIPVMMAAPLIGYWVWDNPEVEND